MTTEDKNVSRIYQEASRDEPPSQLDDAILATARQATSKKSRAGTPFSGGWPVPVSMVAVVIVAVILVPVVMQESTQEIDKPVPATTSDITPEQPSKLQEQRFNSPVEAQSTHDDIQSMGQQLLKQPARAQTPAASIAVQPAYEEDSLTMEAETGRINKQSGAFLDTKKKRSAAPQVLLDKERAELMRSPEEWLAHIEKLLAENKMEQAKLEIEAFALAYPDYNIESELNDLPD